MGCLSNGDYASMVDARLYLPKDWCNDPERCEKAGILESKGKRGPKPKQLTATEQSTMVSEYIKDLEQND